MVGIQVDMLHGTYLNNLCCSLFLSQKERRRMEVDAYCYLSGSPTSMTNGTTSRGFGMHSGFGMHRLNGLGMQKGTGPGLIRIVLSLSSFFKGSQKSMANSKLTRGSIFGFSLVGFCSFATKKPQFVLNQRGFKFCYTVRRSPVLLSDGKVLARTVALSRTVDACLPRPGSVLNQ
jgi:hypothetical protein